MNARRLVALLAISAAIPASASDGPTLSSRARIDATNFSLIAGFRTIGVGALLKTDPTEETPKPSAISLEVLLQPLDGVVDLRGAKVWQLTAPERLFAASLQVGFTSSFVTVGPLDF